MEKDNTEKQFTAGISYDEHVRRADEVYETVVKPQVLENKRREAQKHKIIYDEQGLTPDAEYKKGQWRNIITHSDSEIKGFFGEYRFLSNFWLAIVSYEGINYSSVENAYQAAKYSKEKRNYFLDCTAKEAVIYSRDIVPDLYSSEEWNTMKINIMEKLLFQKFDVHVNPGLFLLLKETNDRYLEETNYWNDTFWGVHTTSSKEKGIGENHLGKLLMKVREK